MNVVATPEQWDIINHPSHTKILACGRRWGKTILMAIYMVIVALKYPGCQVWYLAPNYAKALDLARMMGLCPGFLKLVKGGRLIKQFPPRYEFRNGSTLCFRSEERADKLRGFGLRLICYDEAAYCRKSTYEQVLLPMLMDADDCTFVIASTYNGRNYFYDLAQSGKGDDPDIKTWTYPTPTGVRFQGPKGVARLARFQRKFSPGVWRQECLCEPLAMQDCMFTFLENAISQTAQPKPRGDKDKAYFATIDIGCKPDHTFLIVLECNTGLVCHAEQFPNERPYQEYAQRCRMVVDNYPNCSVWVDATGGGTGGHDEPVFKVFRDAIPQAQPFTFTPERKVQCVKNLDLEIQQGRLIIPAQGGPGFEELISELKLYKYFFGERAIRPTYGAPKGEHDDGAAALMMASYCRLTSFNPGAAAPDLSSVGF